MELKNKFFQNSLLAIFCLTNGFIFIYSDLIQYLSQNKELFFFAYNDMPHSANYDELMYGPSIRRFFDFFTQGHVNFNNPTSLNIDSSPNLQIIPSLIGGLFSLALGGIENFFFLKNFIFPATGLFISFLLLQSFLKSFYLSLFGSVLFYNPYFAIKDVFNYFKINTSTWSHLDELHLLIIKYPNQLSFLFYFVGLISILKIFNGHEKYKFLLIFSLICSAYSYIFSFIILGTIVLLSFIYSWANKKIYSTSLFFAGIISFLFSLPIIYSILFQDYREDMMLSLGFTKSLYFNPSPYIIKSLFICFVTLILIRFVSDRLKYASLIVIFQLLPILIIFPISYYYFIMPEPQHLIVFYHFSKIMLILILLKHVIEILNIKYKNNNNFILIFPVLIISLLFSFQNFIWQKNIGSEGKDLYSSDKSKIIEWIKINTNDYPTILTLDPFLLNTIPTLTGGYNFLPTLKTLHPTSFKSINLKILQSRKILGLNSNFNDYLTSCGIEGDKFKNDLCHYLFYSYYRYDKGSLSFIKNKELIPKDIQVPNKNKQGKSITYVNFNFDAPLEDFIKPEYIIIGSNEKKFINQDYINQFYTKIFLLKDYLVYKKK